VGGRAQDEGVVAELVVLDVEVALPHRADYSIICPRLVGGHQWKVFDYQHQCLLGWQLNTKKIKKIWTISRFVRVILAQGPC